MRDVCAIRLTRTRSATAGPPRRANFSELCFYFILRTFYFVLTAERGAVRCIPLLDII
jgi:hypothetical protein